MNNLRTPQTSLKYEYKDCKFLLFFNSLCSTPLEPQPAAVMVALEFEPFKWEATPLVLVLLLEMTSYDKYWRNP